MEFFGSSPGVNVRHADPQPAALPRASKVADGRLEVVSAAADTLEAAEAPGVSADNAAAHPVLGAASEPYVLATLPDRGIGTRQLQ